MKINNPIHNYELVTNYFFRLKKSIERDDNILNDGNISFVFSVIPPYERVVELTELSSIEIKTGLYNGSTWLERKVKEDYFSFKKWIEEMYHQNDLKKYGEFNSMLLLKSFENEDRKDLLAYYRITHSFRTFAAPIMACFNLDVSDNDFNASQWNYNTYSFYHYLINEYENTLKNKHVVIWKYLRELNEKSYRFDMSKYEYMDYIKKHHNIIITNWNEPANYDAEKIKIQKIKKLFEQLYTLLEE